MKKRIALLLLLFGILSFINVQAQTTGLIFEPADATGSAVLDPNGNGYVSDATGGIGFSPAVSTTNPGNDVGEFELPMLAFPTIGAGEVLSDIANGPNEGFTDFSVNDNGTATYYYLDANDNFIFRFRLADYRPNSKGYTVLIDTDQKFGQGDDPNWTAENPGFEIAIVLQTGHYVQLVDVDGASDCENVVQQYDLATFHQKSISGIGPAADGDADFFYDFYIPYADITAHFTTHDDVGGPVTTTTLLRMTATTNTSNTCAFEGALSDVGGVNDDDYSGCIECLWEDLIEGEVPTDPGGGGFPPERTDCPTILGDYGVGTITLSGISEPNAAIEIFLDPDLVTVIATATADGNGDWTSTSFTSLDGQTYVAIAQVPGESESQSTCTSTTISAVTCTGESPVINVVVNANGEAVVTTA